MDGSHLQLWFIFGVVRFAGIPFVPLACGVTHPLQEEKVRKLQYGFLFAATLLMAGSLPGPAQARWGVTKTIHIGGEGGWDYVLVDARNDRFFITRQTHTQVFSTTTGKVVADIPGQIHSHGTAIVPAVNRGFITDGGGEGSIVVFDLKSYKVLGKIKTMPDSDGIIYDRSVNLILAVSGDEQTLMTFSPDIDLAGGKVTKIDLGGKPEYLASDGSKAYINLPENNLVAVVDLKTNEVIAKWPVAPGGENTGMAIDRRNHLIFLGCRNPQKLIVMSTEDGKIVASLPIGTTNDAVRFADGRVFASCGGNGELVVASQKDGKWQVDQVVKTADGARTMGIDNRTHTIYLATADLLPPPAGQSRPGIKPGTFKIIEVGRQ
jgi:DNA-binding beta-propeller fold protein YncE